MAVDYKKEGRVAIFTINCPEVLNALNAEVRRELNAAMLDFRDNPDLWVGIITGAGLFRWRRYQGIPSPGTGDWNYSRDKRRPNMEAVYCGYSRLLPGGWSGDGTDL